MLLLAGFHMLLTGLHMPRIRIATQGSLAMTARSSPLRMSSQPSAAEGPAASAIRRYFGAWNERDMATAVSQFA